MNTDIKEEKKNENDTDIKIKIKNMLEENLLKDVAVLIKVQNLSESSSSVFEICERTCVILALLSSTLALYFTDKEYIIIITAILNGSSLAFTILIQYFIKLSKDRTTKLQNIATNFNIPITYVPDITENLNDSNNNPRIQIITNETKIKD